MSENKATTKTAIAYKSGFESGYEKGVRDMWEVMKYKCCFNAFKKVGICKTFDEQWDTSKSFDCPFNNCPIAEKLLKAVK